MKILNASQVKAADAYTIENEPVTAISLMERAAQQCVKWLRQYLAPEKKVTIFCGKGNNGGDGLAIARLLAQSGVMVDVYILEFGKLGTPPFQHNLEQLHGLPVLIHYIQSSQQFPQLFQNTILVDALYGVGLDRPLDGLSGALVEHLNTSGLEIIAIDLPSGLLPDATSRGCTIIKAAHTLTFECYKLALLVAENAPFIGEVHLLPIGLHPDFLTKVPAEYELTDEAFIKSILLPRNRFAHKGIFGHALIIGGSYGKMGAGVLAVSACLRSGAGLVSAYIPACGYTTLQTAAPEAMTITDPNEAFITQPPADLDRFNAIGIGPGMGTAKESGNALSLLIKKTQQPLVLDADALNLISNEPGLITQLFQNSILSPHPKEFERLFGTCENDFERIHLAREKAIATNTIIILKGHHTLIALPDGRAFFNSTGNAGMAKGGSGDVLTGILTALLAQGYTPEHASILGVYIHGMAGDVAAQTYSEQAMTATDLVSSLSKVFLSLQS